MAQIKNDAGYRAAMKRIDELLPLTGDEWPSDDPNMNELVILSDFSYILQAALQVYAICIIILSDSVIVKIIPAKFLISYGRQRSKEIRYIHPYRQAFAQLEGIAPV